MSDEPPPKRQRRPPRRFPWCDGRFRCVHCPKALGRDGRGYSRARDVPCSNPDLHLTVNDKHNCDRYWLSDPNAVHFDLPLGRELNRSTGDTAKPGPEGWCSCCDPHDQFLNGRLHAISHTIPLAGGDPTWLQRRLTEISLVGGGCYLAEQRNAVEARSFLSGAALMPSCAQPSLCTGRG